MHGYCTPIQMVKPVFDKIQNSSISADLLSLLVERVKKILSDSPEDSPTCSTLVQGSSQTHLCATEPLIMGGIVGFMKQLAMEANLHLADCAGGETRNLVVGLPAPPPSPSKTSTTNCSRRCWPSRREGCKVLGVRPFQAIYGTSAHDSPGEAEGAVNQGGRRASIVA